MRTLQTLALTALLAPLAASAQSWDLARDFSLAGNPQGAWQYGWANGTETMTLDGGRTTLDNGVLVWWDDRQVCCTGSVAVNPSASAVTMGSHLLGAHQAQLTPGAGGQWVTARWFAPADGAYRIDAQFTSLDRPATTIIGVARVLNNDLLGGGVLAYTTLDPNAPNFSTTGQFVLQAGQGFEVVVGPGNDGALFNAVGVSFHIAAVPEASTAAMLASGLALLMLLSRRRRPRA